MKKQLRKWTAQEKERILIEIQQIGVVAGCRKHGISKSMYYTWLDKYNASGLAGLEDRRGKNLDGEIKRLEKENRMLKELLAEKELESKMKDEMLKKKYPQWYKKGK